MKAESRWETQRAVSSSHSTLIKLEFSQDTTSTKTPSKLVAIQSTSSQRWHLGMATTTLSTDLPLAWKGSTSQVTHPLPDVSGPRWLSRGRPRTRPRLRAGGSRANGEWLQTWKTRCLKGSLMFQLTMCFLLVPCEFKYLCITEVRLKRHCA